MHKVKYMLHVGGWNHHFSHQGFMQWTAGWMKAGDFSLGGRLNRHWAWLGVVVVVVVDLLFISRFRLRSFMDTPRTTRCVSKVKPS